MGKIKGKKYAKDDLKNEIIRFVNEFNKIPISKDFEKLDGYPSRKTFTNVFGNFNDAIRYAGFEPIGVNFRDYALKYHNPDYIIDEIYNFINDYGHTPTMNEFDKYLKISTKELTKELFGSWNNLLTQLDLPLNFVSQYDDDYLKEEFLRFIKENNRVPMWRDFNKSSNYPSFWVYQNRFGSWNKAVKAYGFNIQEDYYNFNILSNQLLALCKVIKEKENRNIITLKDIESCKNISGYSCLSKHMKKNGYTIKSFLNQYGFDIPKEGSGLNYTFEDSEKTRSQYELDFSIYLREIFKFKYNVNYKRDVRYRTFIDGYKGLMDCDYVIDYEGRKIYLEIAGMLRDHKNYYYQDKSINSNIKEEYRLKLKEKENMFKESGLEYYILFPCDLNEEKYKEIFN